jgi:hypothetical protein
MKGNKERRKQENEERKKTIKTQTKPEVQNRSNYKTTGPVLEPTQFLPRE